LNSNQDRSASGLEFAFQRAEAKRPGSSDIGKLGNGMLKNTRTRNAALQPNAKRLDCGALSAAFSRRRSWSPGLVWGANHVSGGNRAPNPNQDTVEIWTCSPVQTTARIGSPFPLAMRLKPMAWND